jgi:hypothetical protein
VVGGRTQAGLLQDPLQQGCGTPKSPNARHLMQRNGR